MEKAPSEESMSRGHEGSDLPLKPVLAVVLGWLGTAAIIYLGIFWLMRAFAHRESKLVYRPEVEHFEQFPEPAIQVDPDQDLRTYLAREEKELNSYGWIDRTAGVLHVPIRQAMDLMLARGVPVRSTEQGPTEIELQQQKGQQSVPPKLVSPPPNSKEKP